LAGLADILKLVERRGQGPSPGFGREHVVLAFLILGASKSLGRQALASGISIGEGSMRTILKKLRQAGLVEVDPAGIQLTRAGVRSYQGILKKMVPPVTLRGSTLTVGRSQAGVDMRSSGDAISSGIQQRDAAVRAGAEGATSYVLRAGKFTVPGGSSDCEKDFPSGTWGVLREELDPHNGDAIIVCGAGDETRAKLGALAAALSLF
jgi:hypothetical protein